MLIRGWKNVLRRRIPKKEEKGAWAGVIVKTVIVAAALPHKQVK